MKIIGNSYITNLSIKVTWDISGVTPRILLENKSTGDNLAALIYWFVVTSPTTTLIHEGTESDPDETGVWTDDILSDAWPRPFNQIEWSGSTYKFQAFIKDGDGNIIAGDVQEASICRPNGNLPDSQNTYGLGSVMVQTKCDQARIYFQDTTNTSYKGLSGTVGSSVLKVNYPMDNTGTVPTPFQMNYFSSAMVPITYSGKGYQFLYTSIYDYDFGNEVHVRIKYLLNDTFGVWCNINLMPLLCEVRKLTDSIESGNCADAESANKKLMLINSKFTLVVIGIFQPLTGVDVPEVIEQIKEIGGFDCDCCNAASGILPVSSAFDGYTFTVVPLGGDIAGEFVPNGFNIQLQLSDISYIFKICDSSPMETTAFTVQPTVNGYTKTYCLNVDVAQLAEDLLNVIKTDVGLVNLFNSIVVGQGGNQTLIVDGKCIFTSGSSFDYVFSLSGIPADTTFALLEKYVIGGVSYSFGFFAFNLTNLPALQAHMNTYGIGAFTVTNGGGGVVVITSVNNTTNIDAILYSVSGGGGYALMTKTSAGYVPKTTSEVVQLIINYLCDLDDSQVYASQEYEVCWADENGVRNTQIIPIGGPIKDVLYYLTTRGCTTVDYIISLKKVTCANLKELFPQVTTEIMQANDVLLGTKNGICAGVYPTEAFLMMLTYGAYSAEVLAAFCNMVNLCASGNACESYNVFFAEVEAGSPGYDLIVTFDHPSAVSNIIRYARIDNTVSPVYTTVTGILPGDSPYSITGLDNGQYRVGIKPIYSDGRSCPELFYDTAPCAGVTSFNAIYDGTNIILSGTAVASVGFIKVTLSYPNGGSSSVIYSSPDGLLGETVTPPAGVFGVFFATAQAVCDNGSGFMSVPSAPASFEIEETSP